MKKLLTIALVSALLPLPALAQYEADTENGVVSLAGREGFSIETKKGDSSPTPCWASRARRSTG